MTPHKITLPLGLCICRDPSCTVPFGECHCRCGKKTTIAKEGSRKYGHVSGLPVLFIRGHGQYGRKLNPMGDLADASPFKIDNVYCRLIPLTQGLYTIVWQTDFEWLSKWAWYAIYNSSGNTYYVGRSETIKKNKQRIVWMHREIIGLDRDDPLLVDHENHNTLDNRRSNLRPATNMENHYNMVRFETNSTGYKGVDFMKANGKYRAMIQAEKIRRFLGYFPTAEAAHQAYCRAAEELHGKFRKTD